MQASSMFKNDPGGVSGLVLTLVFSIIFTLATLSPAFIAGHSIFWDVQAGDRVQHLAGLNMYLFRPWQFPLLNFNTINYPYGGNVAFVDGIPILALLLKIILPKNVGFINPLGYWIALNYLLQAFAAWWITKELRVKSWAFLVFLVLTFLTYPAWMARIIQAALMSHWIILFAIALYIRGYKRQKFPCIGWTLLIFASFYIHIYLFVMALGIYFAAVIEAKHAFTWRHILSLCLPLLILGASLFILFLPLSSDLKSASGFNHLSMNLLSPFSGGQLIQLQIKFSSALDGLNYLGLGVIIIFLWAAFTQSSRYWIVFHRHWMLSLVMLGCFFYSLSNQVYLGEKLVAVVNYPDFMNLVVKQLRASGRFFWPVGYVIVVFSSYMLYTKLKRNTFTLVISLLVIVQCADVSAYYSRLTQLRRYDSPQAGVDYSKLDRAIKSSEKYFYLYPKYTCANIKGNIGLAIMRYAAERQFIFNTGYISRFSGSHCDDMNDQIAQSKKDESVYMFFKKFYNNVDQIYLIMGSPNHVECRDVDFVYVCHYK